MRLALFSIIFFCIACSPGAKDAQAKATFDKEINNRLSILKGMSAYDDSLTYYSTFIHQEVSRFILLSKDVENLQACINRSNTFFYQMGQRFQASEKAFDKLHSGLPAAKIELLLKENELFLLNQIIFNNNGADLQMFSAREEPD